MVPQGHACRRVYSILNFIKTAGGSINDAGWGCEHLLFRVNDEELAAPDFRAVHRFEYSDLR